MKANHNYCCRLWRTPGLYAIYQRKILIAIWTEIELNLSSNNSLNILVYIVNYFIFVALIRIWATKPISWALSKVLI